MSPPTNHQFKISRSVILIQIGHTCFYFVIVISKLLKRHSKAKRRVPAYSRALRLVRGVVQKSSAREVRVRFPEDQRGHRGPEWPSGLVARSPRRRPGFTSRSVGLSEINFSDLYCGWLGRN